MCPAQWAAWLTENALRMPGYAALTRLTQLISHARRISKGSEIPESPFRLGGAGPIPGADIHVGKPGWFACSPWAGQNSFGAIIPVVPDLSQLAVSNMPKPPPLYRGSQKHKNRPAGERKGTLCPEWTHATAEGGYRNDPFAHDWAATQAQQLFARAVPHGDGRRRFATAGGIAFEAKPTEDGTWHGYPVPWEAVPPEIVQKWKEDGEVTRRQITRYWKKDHDDLHWAIEAGE